MWISPLILVLVGEKRYHSFNEREFCISRGGRMTALPGAASVCIAAAFLDKEQVVKAGLWCCQVVSVSFCSALNLSMTCGQPHSVKIWDTEGHSICIQGPPGLWEEMAEGIQEWARVTRVPHGVVGHTSWKVWQILQLRKREKGGVCALKATCSVCKVEISRWTLLAVPGHSLAPLLSFAEIHLLWNEVGWYSRRSQGLNSLCPTSPCWWALCSSSVPAAVSSSWGRGMGKLQGGVFTFVILNVVFRQGRCGCSITRV